MTTQVKRADGRGTAYCAFDEHGSREEALRHCNALLASLNAEQRVRWALECLPGTHVLTSSFGAQAAVSLHLASRVRPDIPVVLIDTGYLFDETYGFIDRLTEQLDLQLCVFRPALSPAWQEARHGRRWENGVAGLGAYNQDNKVEPMKRALRELEVGTWFAWLRRAQSRSRAEVPFVHWFGDRWKVHPIADWSDRDVHRYLKRHHLPYHPLWDEGYVSIGDTHSTHSIHETKRAEETRFSGLIRECGLHEIDLSTV